MMMSRQSAPSKPRLLMCPPDHFDVIYEINPWMVSNHHRVDRGRAMRQWQHLRERVAERAIVEIIDPQPGLPDMVFTANAGAASRDCVVPSHFLPRERRPEESYFKAWFRERGYKVLELEHHIGFEGAGDCLADTRAPRYWVAHGFRTEIEAHPRLEEWFDAEVVSLRLIDPRFYHLDTCFTPLQGGYLMYYPGAFDAPSRDAIRARVPQHYRIEVGEHDACRFACNAVNIDERILLNAASAELQQRLNALGFVVEIVDLSEFIKAGGSAKCLVMHLPGDSGLVC